MITRKKRVFHGHRVNVAICDVKLPSGRAAKWELVEHPGAVAVVALDERDRLVLLRQYRFAVERTLWEIPAGTLEPGESPARAARRELLEETGYRARRLRRLCSFYSTPGCSDERIDIFLATELAAGKADPEPGEQITVRLVPLRRALELIRRGRIQDGKTVAAVLRYAMDREQG
jgi:ADP-ribose pyrophosphatase